MQIGDAKYSVKQALRTQWDNGCLLTTNNKLRK